MKNLADILNGSEAATAKAQAEGFHIAGDRYVVTRIEDNRSIYARKVRHKQQRRSLDSD